MLSKIFRGKKSLVKFTFFSIFLCVTGCGVIVPRHHSYSSNANISAADPHYVKVKGGQIEYYRFGQGSPVVLISGYASDVSTWNRPFLMALAQHHQVIIFNNRDIDGSFVYSQDYTCKDLAEDTYHLIHQLGLKKPALIGLSMGGMIAQEVAVLHPDQLGQLILINTAIAGKEAVAPSEVVQQQMLNFPTDNYHRLQLALNLFFPHEWRWRMAYALAVNRFNPSKEGTSPYNQNSIIKQQGILVQNWVKDNATEDALRKLPIPTLVLNGLSDQVIPPINSEILARTIPHAKLIRWTEGGHVMVYQFPIPIAQTIDHFIAHS